MTGHTARRAATIGLVLAALPVLVLGAPIWIVVGAGADTAHRLWRFPTVRLGLMLVVYVVHEWVCLAAAGGLALARLGGAVALAGRHRDPTVALAPYRRIEGWWASSLVGWAGWLLGIRFDLPEPEELPAGGFILLSRHASMADALLPVHLVTGRHRRFVHYVLKRELRFDPTLDLYGERLGNYFITRTGDGDIEAGAITRLARAALPRSALVIFPEGTYASPRRRARVRGSLLRRGEAELVELADDLDHLLPPKPAGTLALLAGQPGFDVVVLGHVGLEGVSDLAGLRRQLPLTEPVTVRWWHHPRSGIPASEEGAIDWLNDRWRSLDRWVDDVMGRRTGVQRQGETP